MGEREWSGVGHGGGGEGGGLQKIFWSKNKGEGRASRAPSLDPPLAH